MNQHRWSGWPGAFCLDCGEPDPAEQCIGDGDMECMCKSCLEPWPQGECRVQEGGEHILIWEPCEDHQPTECKAVKPEREIWIGVNECE